MRSIGLFILGLFLGACAQSTVQPLPVDAPVTAKELESKTVALALVREDGSARAYCTGVWVGERTILTAHHCLSDEPPFIATKDDVLDLNGRELPMPALRATAVLAEDEDHDLALLSLRGQTPPHGIARVALNSIYPGAKVSTMGHPLGLWWSYSSGDIAAVRFLEADPAAIYVQTTAPTSRGNSGGGLWDSQGYLIGIAHAGIPSGSNLAFYVHGQYVEAFLRRNGL